MCILNYFMPRSNKVIDKPTLESPTTSQYCS